MHFIIKIYSNNRYDAIDKVSSSGSSLTLRETETRTVTLYRDDGSILGATPETINFTLQPNDRAVVVKAQMVPTDFYNEEILVCTSFKTGDNKYTGYVSDKAIFCYGPYYGFSITGYSLSRIDMYIICSNFKREESYITADDFEFTFYYYK